MGGRARAPGSRRRPCAEASGPSAARGSLGAAASAPLHVAGVWAAQVPIRAQRPRGSLPAPPPRAPPQIHLAARTLLLAGELRPGHSRRQARARPSRTPRRRPRVPRRRACWHGRTAGPRRLPPTTRSPSPSWTSWIRRNSPALRSRPCALLPGKPRKVWQRPKRGRTPAQRTQLGSGRPLVRIRSGPESRETPAEMMRWGGWEVGGQLGTE